MSAQKDEAILAPEQLAVIDQEARYAKGTGGEGVQQGLAMGGCDRLAFRLVIHSSRRQPHGHGDRQQLFVIAWRLPLREALREQSGREGLAGPQPIGGDAGERQGIPIDTLPDRLGIGHAVVARPSLRIAAPVG